MGRPASFAHTPERYLIEHANLPAPYGAGGDEAYHNTPQYALGQQRFLAERRTT